MRSASLTAEAIAEALTTKRIGSQVCFYEEIGSTNNEAKRLAMEDCPDGTLVIANEQHGGRGRLSRSFLSPKGGGLWFTLVLRPDIAPTEASKCTLLAALAVAKAIRKTTGIDCGIKWPNDILVNGKKLVGILTEMSADMDGIRYIVCGIGINVNIRREEFAEDIRDIATSVEALLGHPFDSSCSSTLYAVRWRRHTNRCSKKGSRPSSPNGKNTPSRSVKRYVSSPPTRRMKVWLSTLTKTVRSS